MQIEISDKAYQLLQQKSEQFGYGSMQQALDEAVRQFDETLEEKLRIRALAQEGVRSAQEEELVDAEEFFQELLARRNKAA